MRHYKARRVQKPSELLLVPMIDIFTVLVTFLLMTAVFSRITILELDLPSADGGPAVTQPEFRMEVILRSEGFELTDGTSVIAAVPKVGNEYDLAALSQQAQSLKRDHPEVDEASILLEPKVEYDDLIQVMDTIRSANIASGGESAADSTAATTRMELFPNIAVGEAP